MITSCTPTMPKNSSNGRGNVKTESITLRIEKDMLKQLRQESEQKMESINTLANQIFKSYVLWHKPAIKSGHFYVPKPVMAKLLQYLTDEQIAEVAQYWVKSHMKDTITMIAKEFTVSSYLNSFRIWLDISDFNYTYDKNGDVESYAIKFDMDRKFNLYMGKSIQFVFELLKLKDVEFEITDYAVMFKIKRM